MVYALGSEGSVVLFGAPAARPDSPTGTIHAVRPIDAKTADKLTAAICGRRVYPFPDREFEATVADTCGDCARLAGQ